MNYRDNDDYETSKVEIREATRKVCQGIEEIRGLLESSSKFTDRLESLENRLNILQALEFEESRASAGYLKEPTRHQIPELRNRIEAISKILKLMREQHFLLIRTLDEISKAFLNLRKKLVQFSVRTECTIPSLITDVCRLDQDIAKLQTEKTALGNEIKILSLQSTDIWNEISELTERKEALQNAKTFWSMLKSQIRDVSEAIENEMKEASSLRKTIADKKEIVKKLCEVAQNSSTLSDDDDDDAEDLAYLGSEEIPFVIEVIKNCAIEQRKRNDELRSKILIMEAESETARRNILNTLIDTESIYDHFGQLSNMYGQLADSYSAARTEQSAVRFANEDLTTYHATLLPTRRLRSTSAHSPLIPTIDRLVTTNSGIGSINIVPTNPRCSWTQNAWTSGVHFRCPNFASNE